MELNFLNHTTLTVDDVSKASGYPAGFTSLSATDLVNTAMKFGLALTHTVNQTIMAVKAELSSGRPVMVLVNYAALPAANKYDPTYTRGHWLLIVAADNYIVSYHDPYFPSATGGAFKIMTLAQFDAAWATTNSDFSIPRQMLSHVIPPVPANPVIRGVQTRADGNSTSLDFLAITTAKLTGAKIMTNTSFDELATLKTMMPAKNIVLRLFAAGDNPALGNADTFFSQQQAWLAQFASQGGVYVEVHNEQNLPQEGYGVWWMTAPDYAVFHARVADLIHANYPTLKVGWGGLSPQSNVPSFEIVMPALISNGKIDWIGAHSYWLNAADMDSATGGRYYRRFLTLGRPVIITEFANVGTTDSDDVKGQQYKQYYASLETNVLGAYAFITSASDPTFNNARETWVRNNALTAIPANVA